MATAKKENVLLCLLVCTLALTTCDSTEQSVQRWSQQLDTGEEINSYPFLEIPHSESIIPDHHYPYTTNEEHRMDEDSLAAPPPSNSIQTDFNPFSHHDNDGNAYDSYSDKWTYDKYDNNHLQDQDLFPALSDSAWPPVNPPPILRYWIRKNDYDDTTTGDKTTDDKTTDYTTDVTTDAYDSTTDSDFTTTEDTPTSTGYDDDDNTQDNDPPDDDDDAQDDAGNDKPMVAHEGLVVDNPALVVPPGSFFMHCLIHLMVGVCIALGADVWMVGRKRRSALELDGDLSEIRRLFDDVHAAQIMIEGLKLGSQGRRGRCIQRAACLEPRPAQLYAEATDIIFRVVPVEVLRWIDGDKSTFAKMAQELRRGAKNGNTGADCIKKYQCDQMDMRNKTQVLLSGNR